jgi:hypothetical protein
MAMPSQPPWAILLGPVVVVEAIADRPHRVPDLGALGRIG